MGATMREPKYPNVKIKIAGSPADKLAIVQYDAHSAETHRWLLATVFLPSIRTACT